MNTVKHGYFDPAIADRRQRTPDRQLAELNPPPPSYAPSEQSASSRPMAWNSRV